MVTEEGSSITLDSLESLEASSTLLKQLVKIHLQSTNTVESRLETSPYETVKIESSITALSVHTAQHQPQIFDITFNQNMKLNPID